MTVCALAVHASAVRLIFAMARDNNLPFARFLARVQHDDRKRRSLPAVVTGVSGGDRSCLLNVNLPRIIETVCSVAIVWANLAYLMVSVPLLITRLRGWPRTQSEIAQGEVGSDQSGSSRVLAGPVGPSGKSGGGRLGRIRRGQHELAQGRDLRRRPVGPICRGASPRCYCSG